jgi:hypothetical protein
METNKINRLAFRWTLGLVALLPLGVLMTSCVADARGSESQADEASDTASSSAALSPGGTCSTLCTSTSDCNTSCTVDTAQGLKTTTCGTYGSCYHPPLPPPPCQPSWQMQNVQFASNFQMTVSGPLSTRCVQGANVWVTYTDVRCNLGQRSDCESYAITTQNGACSFDWGYVCTPWAL